jgi:CHAD domain-containing protein
MAHSTHREVERKYDVGPDAGVPDLVGIAGVCATGEASEHHMVADYFDTEALDLARLGISLRRRQGGHDSGWHLKVPANGVGRTELGVPLGDEGDPIPAELRALVLGPSRGRPIALVAHLLTNRSERPLVDADGRQLALLCDDRVVAQREAAGAGVVRWREWEVELVEGDEQVLDALEAALLAARAQPSVAQSKIRRALGIDAGDDATPGSGDPDLSGEVLTQYLARYRDRLLATEVGVRLGSPQAIHHMRTATRRLRSVLATYRPLLADPAATEGVRAELQWLGQSLGTPRDAYVLRARLDDALATQPPELVLGPVRARIGDELAGDYRAGLAAAVEDLESARYLALIASLDRLVEEPAYTARAAEPAATELPRLLAREVKRVRRAWRAVPPVGDPQHDERFHELRKKAKRLRYAADSAKPALDSPARSLAKRAKRVQESLGVRQDAVVARQRLRELAVQASLAGENAFTYGRMHALEERRADEAEADFAKAWKRLPTRHVRRRLTGD